MDILVVDDESLSRLAIARTLATAGYSVTTAAGGQEALATLASRNLQLVVCDWCMPGMSGLELCRQVRSTIDDRYIYFLLLTSHNRPEDVVEGLRAERMIISPSPLILRNLFCACIPGKRIIRSESSCMTIFALAKLAESRDSETGAHLERVRSYCRLLAQALRAQPRFQSVLGDSFVRLIYETSPLHDIGKVAIPDSILLKPSRLTPEEFEVMKTHTVHGARTLAAAASQFPNADFLRMAHDIALCHHERYNGSGYPHGLAGEAIPLCGRIVALADVYDALTSKRVYKDALAPAGHHHDCRRKGELFDRISSMRSCESRKISWPSSPARRPCVGSEREIPALLTPLSTFPPLHRPARWPPLNGCPSLIQPDVLRDS